MKMLIITVGTRQVGWKCQDGVIRCLGADGTRGYPKHIDELYAELGLERGSHDEKDRDSRWSVRHLGEAIYNICQEAKNFSPVQLLMDHIIIQKLVAQGLDHILLIGSNQPQNVPWRYRRADTLWLSELMAGKVQEIWPNLKVETWNLEVSANDADIIRQEIEGMIFPYMREILGDKSDNKPALFVENKGCAPAVANTLEICAAALVREFEVEIITPVEPDPAFFNQKGFETARHAEKVNSISISKYFWPLERLRIISAWEQGNLGEAQVWLTSHTSRYPALYKLAGILSKAYNWQVPEALQDLQRSWLPSKAAAQAVDATTYQSWQQQLGEILGPPRQNQGSYTVEQVFLQTWESRFLIRLQLKSGNYTTAFMQFAQTLERLLYRRADSDGWINKGYVQISYDKDPSFYQLIEGWAKSQNLKPHDPWLKLLHRIREKRNDVVHQAVSLTLDQIYGIWREFPLSQGEFSPEATVMKAIDTVLEKVCDRTWPTDKQPILQQVYHWGLQQLRANE